MWTAVVVVVVFPNNMGYFALQKEMSSVVVLAECVDNVLFLSCSAIGKQKVSHQCRLDSSEAGSVHD